MFRWKSIWLRWCNLTINNIGRDLHKSDQFVLWTVRQGDRFSWISNLVSLLVTAVCPCFWDHNPPGGGMEGVSQTCTNLYEWHLITWKLASPHSQRIRNKFKNRKQNYPVDANPKISEHQLVVVKQSSLFYAQEWADKDCA